MCCYHLPSSSARSPLNGSGTRSPLPSARGFGSEGWSRLVMTPRAARSPSMRLRPSGSEPYSSSYLKLGSLNLLMAELRKRGIVSKIRKLRTGEKVDGIEITGDSTLPGLGRVEG